MRRSSDQSHFVIATTNANHLPGYWLLPPEGAEQHDLFRAACTFLLTDKTEQQKKKATEIDTCVSSTYSRQACLLHVLVQFACT